MKHQITSVVVIIFCCIASEISCRTLEVPKGSCSCAAIEADGLEPILQHTLYFNVSCDEVGSGACQRLCTALVAAANEGGPGVICNILNRHIDNLQVGLYTRICNGNIWNFTGIQLPNPICCHEGKLTRCESY